MTTTDETTAAGAAIPAMTEAEQVTRMAQRPALVIVRHTIRNFAIMGALFAAIGWIAEWALGSLIIVPGLDVAVNRMPSIAGALFTALVTVIAGAGYGVVLVVFARRMAAGRMPMDRHEGPLIVVRPAWWVRWIPYAAGTFLLIVCAASIWFLGQWVQEGMPRPTRVDWDSVAKFFAISASVGLVVGFWMLLVDAAEWLYEQLRPKLLASRVWWPAICAVVGVLMTVAHFAMLVGAAYLAQPFFVSLGLGSTRTLGTGISLLLLAGWSGFSSTLPLWGERWRMQKGHTAAERTPGRSDYRNWDIETETSTSGVDANAYPYYLWREGADNRLGLSRSRYCCVTERDDGLYFTFFNPSEKVRSTGGLAVFCGVAALVAIAMFAAYLFETRPALPYHLDRTPPPFLVLIGTLFSALMMGAIISGAWYVLITLLRWYRGRFEGDGHLYMMPLRSLSGFTMAHAGEVGGRINGEKAKSGHGLTAAFDDGSMWILTGNAWDYPSIVAKHAKLTNAFREPRDKYLVEWEAKRKEAARKVGKHTATAPLAGPPRSAQGIPDRL